jgi:hypothetical protein
MTNDNLHLLVNFRSEVSPPDEATARRIYRLATTGRLHERGSFAPRVPRPLLRRPYFARRRGVVALSAAGAAALSLAGLLVALTLSGAAPASAYAAAKKAVAATSAGALDSGTMTLNRWPNSSAREGSPSMVATIRWNGDDLAIASAGEGRALPGFVQLLLVGGGVYVQRADGSWLHFASEADLAPPLYAGTVQAARSMAAGSRAAQIIASAYGLQNTVQPDGSTVYSGTIPPNNPPEVDPSDDSATPITLPGFGPGGAFQMIVGGDGLITQMSETASPPLAGAWSIDYSQLGSTPPITPPATYTEGTPSDLPGPPQEVPTDTAPHPVP